MSKLYAIFAPRERRGIYRSWEDCRRELDLCRNGSSYASFKTDEEAAFALRCGTLREYKERRNTIKLWMDPVFKVKLPCLVVDAACSGAPGPVEYRGVVLPEGYEAFKHGPYSSGTNNIGEYLAIVTGLRWLESTSLSFPIYSDSATAIGWVMGHGRCNTHSEDVGRELKELIARAESWMRGPTAEAIKRARLLKWKTSDWGEIPADFGRK